MTKATTTKMTRAVFRSKLDVTAGDGVAVSLEPWARAGVAKITRAVAETKILRILRVNVGICLTTNIL